MKVVVLAVLATLVAIVAAQQPCAPINYVSKNCLDTDCNNWVITTGLLIGCDFFNITVVEGNNGNRTNLLHNIYPIGNPLSFTWSRASHLAANIVENELWTRYIWSPDRKVLIVDEVETTGSPNNATSPPTGSFSANTNLLSLQDASTVSSTGSFVVVDDSLPAPKITANNIQYTYQAVQPSLHALKEFPGPIPTLTFMWAITRARSAAYEARHNIASKFAAAPIFPKKCPQNLGWQITTLLQDGSKLIKQAYLVSCSLLNETYVPVSKDGKRGAVWTVFSDVGDSLNYDWADWTDPGTSPSNFIYKTKYRWVWNANGTSLIYNSFSTGAIQTINGITDNFLAEVGVYQLQAGNIVAVQYANATRGDASNFPNEVVNSNTQDYTVPAWQPAQRPNAMPLEMHRPLQGQPELTLRDHHVIARMRKAGFF